LECFDNLKEVKYYYDILKGDDDSQKRIDEAKRLGYAVRAKYVKVMNISIDASSIWAPDRNK
jgi:hypothetical protein